MKNNLKIKNTRDEIASNPPPSIPSTKEALDSEALVINYFKEKNMLSKSLFGPWQWGKCGCVSGRVQTHTHTHTDCMLGHPRCLQEENKVHQSRSRGPKRGQSVRKSTLQPAPGQTAGAAPRDIGGRQIRSPDPEP